MRLLIYSIALARFGPRGTENCSSFSSSSSLTILYSASNMSGNPQNCTYTENPKALHKG